MFQVLAGGVPFLDCPTEWLIPVFIWFIFFTGGVYFHDCPAEWLIPLYLVVAGSVGIIKNFSSLCQKVKNDRENAEDENVKTTKFDSLLNCFLMVWFIFGRYLISKQMVFIVN
jgi:hypothetical protein